jgi:hypothetical protein
MFIEITKCRVCGCESLKQILALGEQALTGVFPKMIDQTITKGPLDLVWCEACNLLQMKQSYSLEEMYGNNYGYRSGLNASMVRHLQNKIRMLELLVKLSAEDLVIDIGSNDATSLKAYSGNHLKVGIDPTGLKFKNYYTKDILLIPDFFSEHIFRRQFPTQNAKIVTSIAMFYDLERPLDFIRDIYSILAEDGVWHFEQSYMPSMLKTNSYDTICHEHLEFYSFEVIKEMLEKSGMRVIDVQMNSINGGSFAITACKESAMYPSNMPVINWLLEQESAMGLKTLKPYLEFADRIFQHRESLRGLIQSLVSDGKKIIGYGASTKGNVLLQFCGLTSEHISCIAEVNEEKFGSYTPGTNIPIVSESEARSMNPDYFLVLPWHFKHGILEREQEFLNKGGKFIFPLPEIEIV